MNYGEMKDYFSKVLNRRDITQSLTQTFFENAIQRTQRVLRVPPMEKNVVYESQDGSIFIPGDFLQIIAVTSGPKVYGRVSLSDLFRYREEGSSFTGYTIRGPEILVNPVPDTMTKYQIDYYADAAKLVADTDTNWLSIVAPDCLVYGALSYACDYFLDSRKPGFEERYVQILQELIEQRMSDELSGGATIQPAYNMNF